MTASPEPQLIFVYNADSGLFNTVTDIAHKILSPGTYGCNLCALTHGHFSVREDWVAFLETLPASCEFLHRDEFENQYHRNNTDWPVIFRKTETGIEAFAERSEIDACDTLDTLKQLILSKLEAV